MYVNCSTQSRHPNVRYHFLFLLLSPEVNVWWHLAMGLDREKQK